MVLTLLFLNSLVGADSIDLIDDAVQTAVHYNALGILVTDWSAYGHVSPLEVSLPAFAAGGALAWNSKIKQVRPVSCFYSLNKETQRSLRSLVIIAFFCHSLSFPTFPFSDFNFFFLCLFPISLLFLSTVFLVPLCSSPSPLDPFYSPTLFLLFLPHCIYVPSHLYSIACFPCSRKVWWVPLGRSWMCTCFMTRQEY